MDGVAVDDVASVYLLHPVKGVGRLIERRRHITPGRRSSVARQTERPGAGREQMTRDGLEWSADEGRSPGGVAPLESSVGKGRYHEVVSNIIGLGIDATDIPRIEATIARYGDRFLQRVFTDGEIAYCRVRRNPAIHFAGRFAAKEAAMKALGTGHTPEVLWRCVEVVRVAGPPRVVFHAGARRRFEALGAAGSLLTITHAETLAFAQVLLLGR
jgi:holo-[acyl-carrier protein] synthase